MINWTRIETQYVSGEKTLRELAKEKRVSYSTLSKKASEGGWAAKREKYRAEVASEELARAQERGRARLRAILEADEKMMDAAVAAIADEEQFRRWIVSEGTGEGCSETSEKTFAKIDTKAMKDMVFVMRELTGMLRDAYSLQTPAQELGEKLARERISQVKAQTAKLKQETGDERRETGGAVVLPVIDEVEREEE